MRIDLVIAVTGAGALGALLRYLLVCGLRSCGLAAPWPTACVNVLGCLLCGVAFAACAQRFSPLLSTAVLVGFFGAFTTYSAFALDAVTLVGEGRTALALLSVLLQNALGILGLYVGMLLGNWWVK